MDIRAAEISSILKCQIANFGNEAEVTEVGQVLSSATASPASTVSTRCRPARWSSSRTARAAWR